MLSTLAEAEPVWLLSVVKPLILTAGVIVWARLVVWLSHDADRHFGFSSWRIDAWLLAAGVVACAMWLMITWFWLGAVAALTVGGLSTGAYTFYRNQRVSVRDRWRMPWESLADHMLEQQRHQADQGASIVILDPKGEKLPVPMEGQPQAVGHQALEGILEYAKARQAQRIDMMTDARVARLWVTIDGVRYAQPSTDTATAVALIDYLKEHAGLDLSDRRRRLSGRLQIETAQQQQHTLGVTTFGSIKGLSMAIEIDPESRTQWDYQQLGLHQGQSRQLESALTHRKGVVLVSGPPGHGQTTTMYSLLRRHDPYTQSIITLEERLATDIEGFNHYQFRPGTDTADATRMVEARLRESPDVFMLSLVDTPGIAQALAHSGREAWVYAGMQQLDTFATLRQWLALVHDGPLAAKALSAIVNQRLIRKLCPACRVAYNPDPQVLHKLNLSVGLVGKLYKHSGQVNVGGKAKPCPDCFGIGYRGLVGVFEVMVLDDEARRFVASDQLTQLRTHLRKQKMLWLQEAALNKAVEGVSSIAEITRVLGQESDRKAPSPRARRSAVSGPGDSDI